LSSTTGLLAAGTSSNDVIACRILVDKLRWKVISGSCHQVSLDEFEVAVGEWEDVCDRPLGLVSASYVRRRDPAHAWWLRIVAAANTRLRQRG